MKYSEIIKELMLDKKISQQKIAEILQVNQTTISQWLHGKKKPSFDNIISIYTHFGITPNELLGIE